MFAAVPDGMVVRNSTFTNCAVMDIFFVYPDWWSPLPPPYDNVTLENNTFGQPDGTYSLYIGKIGTSIASSAPVTGWKIRSNRFEGPINTDAPVRLGQHVLREHADALRPGSVDMDVGVLAQS